jgi:hypothetical protein
MADLVTQVVTNTGLAPAYAAASAGGDKVVAPDADTFLHVKNTGGSPVTVTVATPGTAAGGLAIADISVSVPATTGDRMIGPLPAEYYANPADSGKAAVTYSGVTGVTVAAIRVQRPT